MCTYVRELTLREGKRLSTILKTARSAVYLRRAQVVAFSGQGMRVQEIAKRLHLHEEYVRELIRQFDRGGFDGLRPRKSSGRPSKYSPEEVSMMLEFAGTRPQDMGLPFTVWSLLPERMKRPSALKATLVTGPSWASITRACSPVFRSQMRRVRSVPPETRRVPSGL